MRDPYNVLFLCTHNSARSLIAEALLNHVGGDTFRAFSAGSHPSGVVNPHVIDYLREQGLPVGELQSKRWEVFAAPDAPQLDFIITVCNAAAGEACPVWPGHPATAHWGVQDPSPFASDAVRSRQVVGEAAQILRRRIALLIALPLEKLDRLTLQDRLRNIGTAS